MAGPAQSSSTDVPAAPTAQSASLPGGPITNIAGVASAGAMSIPGVAPVVHKVGSLVDSLIDQARDVGSLIKNYPAMLKTTVNGLTSDIAPGYDVPSPELDAISDDDKRRILKGAAFVDGAVAGELAGKVVSTIGARIITRELGMAGKMALSGSRGLANGTFFGGTFGMIAPLDDPSRSRSDQMFSNAIQGGIFGGLISAVGGGVLAYAGRKSAAPISTDMIDALQSTLKDFAKPNDPAMVIRQQEPMPSAPADMDEHVAQVAAGSTSQGPMKSGLFREMSAHMTELNDAITKRWPGVKSLDPSTWMLGMMRVSADQSGAWFGKWSGTLVHAGLTEDERSLLGRALVAGNLRAVRDGLMDQVNSLSNAEDAALAGTGPPIKEGTPASTDILDKLEKVNAYDLTQDEWAQFKSSKPIQEALQRYTNAPLQATTDIHLRNGLTPEALRQPMDVPYITLTKLRPEDVARGVSGTPIVEGDALTAAKNDGGLVVRGTSTAKATPFAKQAAGTAISYVTDVSEILARSMSRDMVVDSENDIRANIATAPWARQLKAGEVPASEIEYNGKTYPTRVIEINGRRDVMDARLGAGTPTPENLDKLSGHIEALANGETDPVDPTAGQQPLGRYVVPKVIADMHDEIFLRSRNEFFHSDNKYAQAFFGFMDKSVGMQLASPNEITQHILRNVANLARLPGIGDDQGALMRLASRLPTFIGPRVAAIRDITDHMSPEALDMQARIAKFRLSPRAFPQLDYATTGTPDAMRKFLHAGADMLFSVPELGGGFKGVEIRAMTSAGLALDRLLLDKLGRKATDMELSNWLSGFGEYASERQSQIVYGLRASRLDAFAANLNTMTGEIRSAMGGIPLPRATLDELGTLTTLRLRAEILSRGVVGETLARTMVQYGLTGTVPWENEQGHRGDVAIGQTADGRIAYLPSRFIEPGLNRAANILGARAILENFPDGRLAQNDVLRNLANTAIEFGAAPGIRTASILATGREPYITRTGELLRVAPPGQTQAIDLQNRLLAAAAESNPTFARFFGLKEDVQNTPAGVRIINSITPSIVLGQRPILRAGAPARSEHAMVGDVVDATLQRAFGEFGNDYLERLKLYKAEAAKFPKEADQQRALRQMIHGDAGRARSETKNAAQQ